MVSNRINRILIYFVKTLEANKDLKPEDAKKHIAVLKKAIEKPCAPSFFGHPLPETKNSDPIGVMQAIKAADQKMCDKLFLEDIAKINESNTTVEVDIDLLDFFVTPTIGEGKRSVTRLRDELFPEYKASFKAGLSALYGADPKYKGIWKDKQPAWPEFVSPAPVPAAAPAPTVPPVPAPAPGPAAIPAPAAVSPYAVVRIAEPDNGAPAASAYTAYSRP